MTCSYQRQLHAMLGGSQKRSVTKRILCMLEKLQKGRICESSKKVEMMTMLLSARADSLPTREQ